MAEKRTVCLDLGHGQATCSMPKLSDLKKDTDHGKYTVERLNVAYQTNIIPTQFILTNEQKEFLKEGLRDPAYGKSWPDYAMLSEMEEKTREIQISNQLPASDENQERFSFFKVCPGRLGESYSRREEEKAFTYGVLMACFVYAAVKNIIVCNDDKLPQNREEIQLLVGCPTTEDWTSSEEKEKYANLIKEATGIDDVRIVPESRAAMFSAVGGSAKSKAISTVRGAIVFDFGSSTADCTYMLMGRKIIEFSWTLGAHHIEENMTNYALAHSNLPDFLPSDSSYDNVYDIMRRLKENYYDGRITGSNANQLVTFDNGTDEATWVGKIDEKFMEQMVGDEKDEKITVTPDSSKDSLTGSWKELCKAFLEEAKKKIETATYEYTGENGEIIEEHCTVENIVLTGGASQMPFIEALCREVFSDEQIAIMRDPNPGYTVSNGLAWVSISDDHRDECAQKAKEMVFSDHNNTIDALTDKMAEAIIYHLKISFTEATADWAASVVDLTGNDLNKMVENNMQKLYEDKVLENAVKNEIDRWKEYQSKSIESAVNDQAKMLYTETVSKNLIIPMDILSQIQVYNIQLGNFNFRNIISKVDMAGYMAMIVRAITDILNIFTLGFFKKFFGEFINKLIGANNMDQARPQHTRQGVLKKIPAIFDAPEIKANILCNINKSMFNIINKDEMNKITENFNKQIEAAIEQAIDIVMLRKFSQ